MADCYFAGKSHTTRFYFGKHVHADYQWGQEKEQAGSLSGQQKKGFCRSPAQESRRPGDTR